MKKIILTSAVLFITAGAGMGVWGDEPVLKPGQKLTKDQAIQLRDAVKQKHQKKAKPAHKIEGKAVKGAPQVSPKPVKPANP